MPKVTDTQRARTRLARTVSRHRDDKTHPDVIEARQERATAKIDAACKPAGS